jgi:hypothetical protein
MKRFLSMAAALMLAATGATAQENLITPVDPTIAVGQTTVIGGATYVAVIAAGVLMLALVPDSETGSSTTGTN